jgi:sulfur carrier protein ThiS
MWEGYGRMVIEVVMHGVLNRHMPNGSSGVLTVDVMDDITVLDLLAEMEINHDEVWTVTVNGKNSALNQILKDGDRLAMYPPEY